MLQIIEFGKDWDMKEFKSSTGRTSLAVQKAPHRHEPTLGQGYNLLLRRNKKANVWIAFVTGKEQRLGTDVVLTYEEAVRRVHDLASAVGKGIAPSTVQDAYERYQSEKEKTGDDTKIVSALLKNLPTSLKDKTLSATTVREWETYRDSLMTTGKSSTARRKWAVVSAALNAAAVRDELNRRPWSFVKRPVEDCESRNVVLPEGIIPEIVREAHALDQSFGLLVELMAETGMRSCQLQRMTAGDVLDGSLTVPKSFKGKGKKKGEKVTVPAPMGLCARLRASALPLSVPNFEKLFRVVAVKLGLTLEEQEDGELRVVIRPAKSNGTKVRYATAYALRHTHITRMLLKYGASKKETIARLHDTSSYQLDKTYAKYLHKHDDDELSLFSVAA
jgi:integrase